MTPDKAIEQKLQELAQAIGSEDRFVENVMDRIDVEPAFKPDRIVRLKDQPITRRFVVSRVTRFAVAALIMMAAALGVSFLLKSVPTAYGIEQTIKANHSVRYLHIRSFEPAEKEPKEFWVEFYEDGQVKNVRMSFPEWAGGGDGPKVVVWKENKAEVWFVKKNAVTTFADRKVAAEMLRFAEENDPRLSVERLCEQQTQGKVKIEIAEPSRKSEPIVVTATYLSENATTGPRKVLFVDRATKLVARIDLYRPRDGGYECTGWVEYRHYNQPIDAEIFRLDEVPADALRVDQTTQEIGLAQGQLSDEQIAVEVVRQFFEALIGQDYTKAGRLLEGIPADKVRQAFGKMRFIRILGIGEPTASALTEGFHVPCTIEVEADGKTTQWQPAGPFVRRVQSQPDRWTISGGI